MQRVRLQTPDGLREVWAITDSADFDAAREDGEIHIGDTIVYKAHLVEIIEDFGMLVLNIIRMANTGGFREMEFDPGMPDFGSFEVNMPDMGANGNMWSFTVNGQPVTKEEFDAATGGTARK